MFRVPTLKFLAAAEFPIIFILVGVVQVQNNQVGIILQNLTQHQLIAPDAETGNSQIDDFGLDSFRFQDLLQLVRVSRLKTWAPGHRVAQYHDAKCIGRPLIAEPLGVKPAAAGSNQVYRAVFGFHKTGIEIVAVRKPPGDIMRQKNPDADFENQQQEASKEKIGK